MDSAAISPSASAPVTYFCGAPQKYVTGALAEGEIAAESILEYLEINDFSSIADDEISAHLLEIEHYLSAESAGETIESLEEEMQSVMDQYAGGIGTNYRFNEQQLCIADEKIRALQARTDALRAADFQELMYIYELRERLTVCRSVIAHLAARRETRWHSFAENADYPARDDTNWNVFVNSRMENGEIRIILRPLAEGGAV